MQAPTPSSESSTGSEPPTKAVRPVRYRVTIKSILVITTVFAAVALSLRQLYRAATGDPSELGQFVITTAMMPLVMLAVASLFFRIFGRWLE